MAQRFLLATLFFLVPFLPAGSQTLSSSNCPVRAGESVVPAKQIRIRDIKFEGATRLSLNAQNEIASNLLKIEQNNCRDWLKDMEDRVRNAWQHRGFFFATAKGESKELSSAPGSVDVALTFRVNEGEQYRLGEIQFLHNQQFTAAELRSLVPINQDEVFDTGAISNGMAGMHKKYGEIGFLDCSFVPQVQTDPKTLHLVVTVDIDEGKQFHIAELKISWLDEKTVDAVARQYHLEPGAVFDTRRLAELASDPQFKSTDDFKHQVDEKNATVTLTITRPQNH